MLNLKVGKQIKNNNGTVYTVLASYNDCALLVGGWDYVVITDLSYFENSGNWSGGKYFPFFEDPRSTLMLQDALAYFCNISGYTNSDYENNQA